MRQKIRTITDYLPLIDALGDYARLLDPDKAVVAVNRAMQSELGEEAARSAAEDCEFCAEGKGFPERQLGERTFSVRTSPLTDAEGRLLGYAEVYREITEEVRIRKDLMRTNAKMTQDLSMARGLQKAMFRKKLPEVEGYRFTMGFYPCDAVGGDACDCMVLRDGRVLFYVADVSGHGVRAAMLTVFLRQEILLQVKNSEVIDLETMAEGIRKAFLELNPDDATYITMFMVLLDPETGECRFLNAGHSVAPLLLEDGVLSELYVPGPPFCKWSDHAGSPVGRFCLKPGGRAALFTDGVMEDCGGVDAEAAFREGLSQSSFRAEEFINRLNHLHDKNRTDDILLMVCERTA